MSDKGIFYTGGRQGGKTHALITDLTTRLNKAEAENARLQAENFDLKRIAVDLHWMARRYADGRCTYAPGMVNNAVRQLQTMGVTLNICGEKTPWARDGMGPGYSGLSKEEYELGESVDGWNHIAGAEEIKALAKQLDAEKEQTAYLKTVCKNLEAACDELSAQADGKNIAMMNQLNTANLQLQVAREGLKFYSSTENLLVCVRDSENPDKWEYVASSDYEITEVYTHSSRGEFGIKADNVLSILPNTAKAEAMLEILQLAKQSFIETDALEWNEDTKEYDLPFFVIDTKNTTLIGRKLKALEALQAQEQGGQSGA